MTVIRIEVPWEKYGTIAYLAEQVSMCGKTALQKLVYFLQEWKHVPLGYNYEFYTYGPFSAALMGDLDYTDSLGAVRVKPIGNGGYCIGAGDRNKEIQERAQAFLSEHKLAIDSVIEVFGHSSAVRLELLATTHYAFAYFASRNVPFADDDVIRTVHSLKPGKFTDQQIEQAVATLREHGVIAN